MHSILTIWWLYFAYLLFIVCYMNRSWLHFTLCVCVCVFDCVFLSMSVRLPVFFYFGVYFIVSFELSLFLFVYFLVSSFFFSFNTLTYNWICLFLQLNNICFCSIGECAHHPTTVNLCRKVGGGGTEIWCSCSFFSNSQINRHRLNWYRYYDNFVIVVLETSLDSYSLQCLICLRLCVQWKISGVKCIFPLFPVYSHLDYVLHPLMHICMYVCGQKQHHYVGDGAEEEL